jgi:hypothetical protein
MMASRHPLFEQGDIGLQSLIDFCKPAKCQLANRRMNVLASPLFVRGGVTFRGFVEHAQRLQRLVFLLNDTAVEPIGVEVGMLAEEVLSEMGGGAQTIEVIACVTTGILYYHGGGGKKHVDGVAECACLVWRINPEPENVSDRESAGGRKKLRFRAAGKRRCQQYFGESE